MDRYTKVSRREMSDFMRWGWDMRVDYICSECGYQVKMNNGPHIKCPICKKPNPVMRLFAEAV